MFNTHTCTYTYTHLYTGPSFVYTVQTLTGRRPGAGTNANVYIILHDHNSHSDKIWLDNSRRSFLSGQRDTFEVKTGRLFSTLEAVTVGHDNSGPSPGWFLEQVGRREREREKEVTYV